MRKKNYKGRCEKRQIDKFTDVCRTYDELQYQTALMLAGSKEIKEIQSNVALCGLEYSSDFVFKTREGELGVRECVYREHLRKPMTLKLLDLSRVYWLGRGVEDWAIVIEKRESEG